MVLIDKMELLKKAHTINVKEVGYTHHCVDYLDVLEAPAVEAEPIKHGRWIPVEDDDLWRGYVCSRCNRAVNQKENYCPSCGAIMDEVEK